MLAWKLEVHLTKTICPVTGEDCCKISCRRRVVYRLWGDEAEDEESQLVVKVSLEDCQLARQKPAS